MRAFNLAIGLLIGVAIGFAGGWYYAIERLPFQAEKPPKEALAVVDGDTVRLGTQRLRILNIDAPETDKARCDRERELGKRATNALTEKINEAVPAGAVAIFPDGTLDKYRRPRVRIEVHGNDVSEAMIADGLARVWQGRPSDWCN